MKKAKIVLTSLALLAIVGGAFAYKAAKFNTITVYTCNNQAVPSLGTCVAENVAGTSSVAQEGYSLVIGTTANVGTVPCTSPTPCAASFYTITAVE